MRTGVRLVIVPALVLPIFAACGSQRPDPIGTSGQALLAQGQYCTDASECTTGFCVDGVCCNTACGGTSTNPCGVSDIYSCSNIYGTVAGLVDGTCTLLQVGQACGDIPANCDPCQARGSQINNGNNCANPQLFSRNGLVCRSADTCTAQAICTNGTCPAVTNTCSDSGTDGSGDGSSADGSSVDGSSGDGSSGDGSSGDGSSGDGSVSDGSVSDGSVSDGSTNDGSVSDGSVGDGSTSDGSAGDGGQTDGSANDGATSDAGGGDAGKSDGGTADAGSDGGKKPDAGQCSNDKDCPANELCATSGPNKGLCVQCENNQQCGATETCDIPTGKCVEDNGTVEGGGCSCTTSGSNASSWPFAAIAVGFVVTMLSRRRRRR